MDNSVYAQIQLKFRSTRICVLRSSTATVKDETVYRYSIMYACLHETGIQLWYNKYYHRNKSLITKPDWYITSRMKTQ